MSAVWNACVTFFSYAVIALFAQNAIFSRGLGVSRMVQLVGDDEVNSLLFGLQLCVIQLLVAPLGRQVNLWLEPLGSSWRPLLRPLVYVLCVGAVCGVLYAVLQRLPRLPHRAHLIEILPIAGFNSTVVGTLLVTTTQNYSLAQSLGFGLGSGLGFLLAVLMVTEAQRKLRSRAVPEAFRGLPVTLVYIGILAMAIYGFTGHGVAI